ncbi:hypothetical protein [Gimesia algae]|uniref:DUF255 domain-containing protein n=1 Tax=Gimesia algae TaxID=2527971 RepID=A0A517VLD1_9PLAN|nr:hypothetical protein [Gimesia algae]QDT93829.1 hypothetical protein Pan161_55160 [Gimesia algae]
MYRQRKNIHLTHLAAGTLVTLALVLLSFLVPFPAKSNRIIWTPYSLADIHQYLEEGRLVLISARASWCISSAMHEYGYEYEYSRDPDMLRLVYSQPIACYQIDLAELPEEQLEVLKGYLNDTIPLGVILLAQNSKHEVIKRAITIEGIYKQQLIPEIRKLRELQTQPSYRAAHIDP